ncbi:MAG: hypothetical protein J6R26_01690 [Paludibacteraceae bacterium]|nr:hypothetical protein [Paludibacteraceae bacterium]
MSRRLAIFLLLCGVVQSYASPLMGVDSVGSTFYNEWYQYGELAHYLDNMSEYVLYEAETTGEWSQSEQKVFSIRGNSFKWNKYYYQDFRVDSRFLEGSTLLQLDMQQHSLNLDYERGRLYFVPDSLRTNQVKLTGNVGGIGGISPGTAELIRLFHSTASDRVWKPITERNHILGAGQMSIGYAIPHNGKRLYQHLSGNYGVRRQVKCDETGISGIYDTPYYDVQLDGELPFVKDWSLHYILLTQHRKDWNTEFTFAPQEQAQLTNYSISTYVNNTRGLTTGLTYALYEVKHNDLSFERNVVDQDGEGLEPWYADGTTHELSWALKYDWPIKSWLRLSVDAYNSLMVFRSPTNRWTNRVYAQYADSMRRDYYDYHFESHSFTAGILENEVRLLARKTFRSWLTIYGDVALALDGVVLRDKHLVMPSWEGTLGVAFHPVEWFDAEILLGNYRARYGWNMVQLLSSDYLNAQVRYVESQRVAEEWGGQYIEVDKGLAQPQYAVLDIPIRFTVNGIHEFAVLSTARKYYNCQCIARNADGYILTSRPKLDEAGVLFNTPFYMSNTLRYSYMGRKTFFSLSWQSYQMSGTSLVGNGPLANNIDALSYSMVYPYENLANSNSPVMALGRLNQDRAYVARMQLGVNFTENWGLSANFHFKDGTPISNYYTEERVTSEGDRDIVVIPGDTKGINVSDGHFGKRKDAFFNLDMRLRYRGNINMRDQRLSALGAIPFEVQVTGYNLYDFGTGLVEYNFDLYMPGRRTMTLCIPRGLMLSMRIGLGEATPRER